MRPRLLFIVSFSSITLAQASDQSETHPFWPAGIGTAYVAVAAVAPSGKLLPIKVDEDGYVIPSKCKN